MHTEVPLRRHQGWWLHDWASGQDWAIVADVYHEDCYRLRQVEPYRTNETIVDVGACIGAFERLARERNPDSHVYCVEVCPENIPVLQANVGENTRIIQAALTYETEMVLMNAVFPECASTGGSIICTREHLDHWESVRPHGTEQYKADRRPIDTLTLERLMDRADIDFVDILKLDCEGSEYSILEHCDLSRIGMIVGEYHGWDRFNDLCTRRFAGRGWHLTVLKGGHFGCFWLNRMENLERNGIHL